MTVKIELSDELARELVRQINGALGEGEANHSACSFSSWLDGSMTAGTGKLDEYGYWEFPCAACIQAANRAVAAVAEAAKPAVRYRVIDRDGDAWFTNRWGQAEICGKWHLDDATPFATRDEAEKFIAERGDMFRPYAIVEVAV